MSKTIFFTLSLMIFTSIGLSLSPTSVGQTSKQQTSKDELDTNLTQLSKNGTFRVTVKSQLDPIAINKMHRWVIHLETKDGKAIEGASLSFDARMPKHRHGLPTTPQVTDYLGNGDYLVKGVRFSMGGWWQMRVDGNVDGKSIYATFNLIL